MQGKGVLYKMTPRRPSQFEIGILAGMTHLNQHCDSIMKKILEELDR